MLDTVIIAVAALFAGSGLLAVGYVFGVRNERWAWLLRAWSRDPRSPNTPHHCDGRFYFIIPEDIFCKDFLRRLGG